MGTREESIRGTVKQYPYRSAHARDIFLILPREDLKELEQQLADASGNRVDNHTVYEITQDNGTTYVHFSDSSVWFGRSLNEGHC